MSRVAQWTSTGGGRWRRRSRCGPSRSARCSTTSAPAGCRSSRTRGCSRWCRGWLTPPSARAACAAAGLAADQLGPYERALAVLAETRHDRGGAVTATPDARVPAARPLVEHFAAGLDAPICLTWELTYACNLACAHCLSSSGRRDPRELTTAEAKAVIDELQRMQVFYVNIGGGEPTVRPDFWELVDYATDAPRRGEVLHQRRPAHPGRGPPDRRQRLRRRAGLAGRRDRGGQRRGARRRLVRDGGAGDGQPRRRRRPRLQALRRLHPAQRRRSWTRSRRSPTRTAPSCG